MQAMYRFVGIEQARRGAQSEAVGAHHQHAAVHAQAQRELVDMRSLPAVAVEDHQLAHACTHHAVSYGQPQPEQGLQVNAQRAFESRVFEAVAHRERRQHEHRAVGRQPLHHQAHDALVDDRVGRQRQVRPVLLDGSHRQQRDRAIGIDFRAVGGAHVLPKRRGRNGRRSRSCRALVHVHGGADG
jgi:hypothetical protein